MTIRLGRRLADHQYFVFHLILYALRSLGFPRLPMVKHDFVLMVIVDAVSVSSTPASKMRTTIKNIVAVPLCIVLEEVIDSHTALLPTMTPDVPVHGLWVATTGIYPEGESCRFRMNLLPGPAYLVSEIGLAHFSLDLYSHSYGVRRRVTAELDFLFEWVFLRV
jgi:hypothetical protein